MSAHSIKFDDRGREILSDRPVAFNVPAQRRISTLDFHRERLLQEREMMRRMIEDMKAESEYETFEEANDFRVRDDLDEDAEFSDFELADDGLDALDSLAREEYRRVVEQTVGTDKKDITGTDS